MESRRDGGCEGRRGAADPHAWTQSPRILSDRHACFLTEARFTSAARASHLRARATKPSLCTRP
eukprot:3314824-Pleurochrysis_carterae.AAC.1